MIVKPRQGSCILLSVFKWRAVLVNLPALMGAQLVADRHPPFCLFFVQNNCVCLSIHSSQDTETRSKDWMIHDIDPQTGTVVSPDLTTQLNLWKGARLWLRKIPVFPTSLVCCPVMKGAVQSSLWASTERGSSARMSLTPLGLGLSTTFSCSGGGHRCF